MPDDLLRQAAVSFCVSEDLRFGELVGQGAFKQTFKVFGPDETTLALKVHRPGASPERTEREIEAMELCDHPNIGRLHQVSTIEVRAQSYVVTLEEFLGGGTLSDRVERSGLVTAVQLVALGAPLIDALQHIADHSLVHRDIKPENILFREDGVTPVIVDFGLVRALERSPLTRSWIIQGPGTPFYAAPEQLNNESDLIDWRTDQFCLGVTLFFSRHGYHPYGDERTSAVDVIQRVAERRGPSEAAADAAGRDDLGFLIPMLHPWPYGRYRFPNLLLEAWLVGD